MAKNSCRGKHTLDSLVEDADSVEQLKKLIAAWPGMHLGYGDNKAASKTQAKDKARKEADTYCGLLTCPEGTCHESNFKFRVDLEEERFDGWLTILTVTEVTCKCG